MRVCRRNQAQAQTDEKETSISSPPTESTHLKTLGAQPNLADQLQPYVPLSHQTTPTLASSVARQVAQTQPIVGRPSDRGQHAIATVPLQ